MVRSIEDWMIVDQGLHRQDCPGCEWCRKKNFRGELEIVSSDVRSLDTSSLDMAEVIRLMALAKNPEQGEQEELGGEAVKHAGDGVVE